MRTRYFATACSISAALLLYAAAAPAQTFWKKSIAHPLITVGPAGAWDSELVESGSVIRDDTGYRLWYAGRGGVHYSIGLATSPDGIAWTKHPNNPVFEPAADGAWDSVNVYSPSVVFDGQKYHLYYGGSAGGAIQIGHATSDDGIAWTRDPANPVIRAGNGVPAWQSQGVDLPGVIYAGGAFKMWYTGTAADNSTSAIGHAESADGTSWTEFPGNPVLAPEKPFVRELFSSSVVFDSSFYHVWYAAWSQIFPKGPGVCRIFHATSQDGTSWNTQARPALRPGPRYFLGWDGGDVYYPTVILDEGQFKMWYTGNGRFGNARNISQIGYAVSPAN